uniref:Uncharacterized protein n=1 Tax=Tolypocladium ophioglossoides (strain CBS 100239) TaxID=1163406 RepID=A0A0L0NFJ2_TOLOC
MHDRHKYHSRGIEVTLPYKFRVLLIAPVVREPVPIFTNGKDCLPFKGLSRDASPLSLLSGLRRWPGTSNAGNRRLVSLVLSNLGLFVFIVRVLRYTNVANLKVPVIVLGNFVAHGEAAVVRRWPPDVSDPDNIRKVDNVQPAIQNEPPGLPMKWNKVGVTDRGEREAVEEEEAKDDQDASQDSPPQFLVHGLLDVLLALSQVLECEIE